MKFLLFAGWWALLLYLLVALWRADPAEVGSFGNFIGVGFQELVGREMGFLLLLLLSILSIKIYRGRVDQRVATLFLGLLLLWFGGELLQGLFLKKGMVGVVITDYFLRGFGFIGTLIGYLGILASGLYLLYEEGGAGVTWLGRYLRVLFKLGKRRMERWWVEVKVAVGGWRVPRFRWRYWVGEVKNLFSWGPKRRLWQLRREIKKEVARRGLEVESPPPGPEEGGTGKGEGSLEGERGEPAEREGGEGETLSQQRETPSVPQKPSNPQKGEEKIKLDREPSPQGGERGPEVGTSAPLYPLTLLNRSYSPPTNSQTEGEKYRQVLEEVVSRLKLGGKVELKGEGPLLYLYKIHFKTPISDGIFRRFREEVEELFWERRPFLKLESFSEVEVQLLRRRRRKLYLRELLELEGEATLNYRALIGVDPLGTPLLSPLSELRGVLVTGESKSGKTLFIGALLLSLLYRHPPSSLQLLLFNRDRGEGVVWGGIPHLLTPPISELVPLLESLSLLLQNPPKIPTIVVIEGLELLIEEGGGEELLRKLGRVPNLHLWATLPARELEIGVSLLPLFPKKVAFKMDRHHSQLLFQSPIGEYLADFGDGVLGGEKGWTRFHPPYLRRLEIRKVLNHLRGSSPQ